MTKSVDYSSESNSIPTIEKDEKFPSSVSQKSVGNEILSYGISSFILFVGYSLCVGGLSVLSDGVFHWNILLSLRSRLLFALALHPVKNGCMGRGIVYGHYCKKLRRVDSTGKGLSSAR